MNETTKGIRYEILIHVLVWVILFFLPYAFTVGAGRPWIELFVHFWLQLLFLATIFYINYFYFVNKWLFNRKPWLFWTSNAALIALFVWSRHEIFISSLDTLNAPPKPAGKAIPMYYMDSLVYLIPVAFAIAIQSGKRLVKMDDLKKEAYNIKLQSELQHLKYQLQPHFFFNSLNNIYGLIDSDPEKAKQTVHSLSKLMRHLFRNSEEEFISLSDEIDFLKKFIALMSLRQHEETKVTYDFPENTSGLRIAPLLFVSIVENAFKHGISATKPSWLFFGLTLREKSLVFTSKNINFPKQEGDMSGSGIGMDNLVRRLDLLYEGKYVLSGGVQGDLYVVNLTLDLTPAA